MITKRCGNYKKIFLPGYGVASRYLEEKHLFSIYKKIVKYYPNKAEEFVKMVIQ